MSVETLENHRILVVEDEYLLADDLHMELERLGAIVIGPVGGLAAAQAIISSTQDIHAAVLDANLKGELVFPAADNLVERKVPIIFVTGYDAAIVPERFRSAPRCEKPVGIARIIETLLQTLADG